MPSLRKHLVAAATCIALAGCGGCLAVKLNDESNAAKYRDLIGHVFILKSESKVYCVRRDLRAKTPDFYEVVSADGPGIGGPEIMDFGRLPAGTRVRLVAAYEEALLGATTYEVVALEPAERRFVNLAIRINNASGFHLYQHGKYPSGAPKLNEKRFAELAVP